MHDTVQSRNTVQDRRNRAKGRPPFECIALLLQGGGALGAYQAGVYEALAEADLDPTGLTDAELRARLTALPGIGGWTVDWFLARTLGRPDAFAAGDLGVRKAVARWFSDEPIWPEARVREACLELGEHANLAVHYLLVPHDGVEPVPPGR